MSNNIYATVTPKSSHLNGGVVKDKRRRNSYIDQPPKFTLSPIEPPENSEFFSPQQHQETQRVKVTYRDPSKHRFHVVS